MTTDSQQTRFAGSRRSTDARFTINPVPGWQRVALYGAVNVLLLTGVLWLGVHYTIGAGAGELPQPAEAWLMRLHGLAGFLALFVFGVLAAAHIPHGWRATRHPHARGQRGSGIALCVLGACLALSAWLLYYFAPEYIRPTLGWLHAAAGLAMGVVLSIHRDSRRIGVGPLLRRRPRWPARLRRKGD